MHAADPLCEQRPIATRRLPLPPPLRSDRLSSPHPHLTLTVARALAAYQYQTDFRLFVRPMYVLRSLVYFFAFVTFVSFCLSIREKG